MEIGDHFWPAVYPGLAIGLIYGLHVGGLANAALGSPGGIVTAFAAFALFTSFFAQGGLLPLASLMAVSLLGAFGVIQIGRQMAGNT